MNPLNIIKSRPLTIIGLVCLLVGLSPMILATQDGDLDKYSTVELSPNGIALWAWDSEEQIWKCYDPRAPVNDISCETAVELAKRFGLYEDWEAYLDAVGVEIPCTTGDGGWNPSMHDYLAILGAVLVGVGLITKK